MSGGAFDYVQFRLLEIEEGIKSEIEKNDIPNEWGEANNFSKETLKKFQETIETVRKARLMSTRVDWLLSGDDGEDSFHKRWDEDLGSA
jgi:hypothetical protein